MFTEVVYRLRLKRCSTGSFQKRKTLTNTKKKEAHWNTNPRCFFSCFFSSFCFCFCFFFAQRLIGSPQQQDIVSMSPSSSPLFCCAISQAGLWAFAVSSSQEQMFNASRGSSCNNLHLLRFPLSSSRNPIIYSICKRQFRATIKKMSKKLDFVDILSTTITTS